MSLANVIGQRPWPPSLAAHCVHVSEYTSYHGCFDKGIHNGDCQKYEIGSRIGMDYQHRVVTPYMPKMLVDVLLRFALPLLLIAAGRVPEYSSTRVQSFHQVKHSAAVEAGALVCHQLICTNISIARHNPAGDDRAATTSAATAAAETPAWM